ncbi:riboflavin transporter MCH5 [Colletotrichum godetiae]|uniref:Riboflavin transporter MCH5 n=1 Tax=Colletotrichum godetiae TaxID=1209918 RepID=A0AAJ0APN1_9PEZI|nr:riboflavin transporter MCH5 [Colletotrichum godetiae]KAK1676232.1 riboflavin transporter MCH5 [Colletotrichum godetiae]
MSSPVQEHELRSAKPGLSEQPLQDGNATQQEPHQHHVVDVEHRNSAWVCVLGSFLFLMPSFGFMQSSGAIQSFLLENQLRDYSARDVGWITGVSSFLTMLLGIQAGPLMDVYGPGLLGPIAAGLLVLMFFLLAECAKFWHFILCLGVLGGIGNAIATTVGIAVIGKLFNRRKGLALGIALSGSSTGGIIFPLALRQMFPMWGWKWSMRVMGVLATLIMILGIVCLLPFERLNAIVANEGIATERSRKKAVMDFSAFRSVPFSLICGAIALLEFVIFGATAILPTLVALSEFSMEHGFNMLAILNGFSSLGRIFPGLVGDRLVHYNILLVMIVFTIACTAASLTAFGSTRIDALYAFSALWGFGTGSFLSLAPACVAKTCEPKDYGRYYGTMNFVISFSLLLTMPIGGQMLESLGSTALSGLYLAVVFAGGTLVYVGRSVVVGSWANVRERI